MRALTIHQPYADLIASGAKTIEVRRRPLSYRGPLLIHAAKDRDVRAPQVLAVADLVDCRRFEHTPADMEAARIPPPTPGFPLPVRWALCLAGARKLPGRIHWPGRQGLWIPDGELQELVADSLSPWGQAAAAAAQRAEMRLTWRDGLWRVHPPGDAWAKPRFDASLDAGLVGDFNRRAVMEDYTPRLNGGDTVVVCCWTGYDADRAYRALKNIEEDEDVHDKRRAAERRFGAYRPRPQRQPAEIDKADDGARREGADGDDHGGAGGGDGQAADGGAPRRLEPESRLLGRPGRGWVEAFAHVRRAPAARGAGSGAGGAADPGDATSISRGGELMPERHDDGIDRKAQAAEVALAERIRAADEAFGAGADYDRDRVTAEVRHHLDQGALAMLEAGRRLCWLRDREPHGDWLPLLERIGVHERAARRMMHAARRFAGGPNRTLVSGLGSVTKVYELAMLDDEGLNELREGGRVAGLTLDDIDQMAPSELRAALRAERKERKERADSQKDIAARRQERLDALEEENERLRRPYQVRWTEAAAARLSDMYSSKSEIVRHAQVLHAVLNWCEEHVEHVDPRAGRYCWEELRESVDVSLRELEMLADMLKVPPEAWQEDLAADGEQDGDDPTALNRAYWAARREAGMADDE